MEIRSLTPSDSWWLLLESKSHPCRRVSLSGPINQDMRIRKIVMWNNKVREDRNGRSLKPLDVRNNNWLLHHRATFLSYLGRWEVVSDFYGRLKSDRFARQHLSLMQSGRSHVSPPLIIFGPTERTLIETEGSLNETEFEGMPTERTLSVGVPTEGTLSVGVPTEGSPTERLSTESEREPTEESKFRGFRLNLRKSRLRNRRVRDS